MKSLPRLVSYLVFAALSLCAWIASPYAAETAPTSHPTVHTDKGDVRGSASAGHREFLGVPFAAPPVGDLRFAPPQPHQAWNGTLDATKSKSSCPQLPSAFGAMASDQEDCLYLNIYTPAKAAGPLPVFFWIHGGGFSYGVASSPVYNGVNIAKKGKVVVVSTNYRLNAFGFLAASALSKANHVSGNYGIEDQQAALRWVQRNIASFGGDPHKVTIVGESAGAASVTDHLLSPGSKGLFRAAIGESTIGIGQGLFKLPTLAEAQSKGDQYVAEVGCGNQADPVKCLRSLSVEALLAKTRALGPGALRWGPVLDGMVLTQQPADAFASGQFNQVPIINGTNKTEAQFFLAREILGQPVDKTHPFDFDGYASRVKLMFKAQAPEVLELYPASDYNSPVDALAAVQTDSGMACSGSRAVRVLAAHVPIYQYEFNEADAALGMFPKITGFVWQDPHAVELQYVFGNFFTPIDDTPAHRGLSDRMIAYWTNFAKTLNPSDGAHANLPNWPAYKAGGDSVLSLADDTAASNSYRKNHKCDFWDKVDRGM